MFGFKKRSDPEPLGPLGKFVQRIGAYAAQLVVEQTKLLAMSPNPNATLLEIFIFNLWCCHQVLGDFLLKDIPHPSKEAKENVLNNLRSAIAVDCAQNGIPFLITHYKFHAGLASRSHWEKYIEDSMIQYDASAANHIGPAWNSAIIRLKTVAKIPYKALEADLRGEDILTKEAATVFARIQKTVVQQAEADLG